MFLGIGSYLTILAGIGVYPWDTLNLGLVATFGIKYGTASITVSILVVLIDVFVLHEKIGLGTVLNAIVVGKAVDLYNYLNLLSKPKSFVGSLVMLLIGILIFDFGCYLYMESALGCGPRDSMLVGLSRRTNKLSIGAINTIILICVTAAGWLLGGKVGIGTVISALITGPIMQLVFKLMRFDATGIVHQDIIESCRILIKGNAKI